MSGGCCPILSNRLSTESSEENNCPWVWGFFKDDVFLILQQLISLNRAAEIQFEVYTHSL